MKFNGFNIKIFDILFTHILLYNYKLINLNTMGINLTNFLSSKSKNKRMNEFQDLDHIEGISISTVNANLYGSQEMIQ